MVQTEHYGDWVYINNVFAHEEYKNVGVETAILRRLVEYVRDVYSGNASSDTQIHKEDPGIVAVWARHFPDDFDEDDAYTQAGFEDRGKSKPPPLMTMSPLQERLALFIILSTSSHDRLLNEPLGAREVYP